MGGHKKFWVIIMLVVFFMLGFTFKISSSANGEIQAIKYIDQGSTSHIQIITHKNIKKLTIEALNQEGEMSHFFTLEDYVMKRNPEITQNIFYITNRVGGLEDIHELFVTNGGNIKIPIELEEVQEVSVSEVVKYTFGEGSVNPLKIMSYNIHHGKNLYGRYSLDEIAEVIKNSGADIVGLQEIDNGVIRSRFEDQIKYLSEKLSMEYVYGYNINILGGTYGNGILSKYPIESYENLLLPSGREQRGLLRATIKVNNHSIHFLSTHLGLNQGERKNQINAIDKYLDILSSNIILVGDFNARPHSREIQHMSKRLVDAAHKAAKGDEPTFDLPVLSGRIDYIFVDQKFPIQRYQVIKSRASDHYPITAIIKLE
ncbi:endonuclease/exonuclease/phosphatase family protein [Natronincola ferrireducens]|uniref:Metal-dependent hydrolase, endonuclease/exonuclease/phosphatase family n=1 Tax=Natronincola ferrireducens TaxID=393762 RepID=A0A1G9BEM3_9FIRM|nr:endonuclease/exonuclease/phosphatase family protein [Natronincola ferrireducens]SDK37927.1 Metal-dependent hydrolase, endonuclease/exonuclease/phosphatase family [Natronincola ferrireducens]